MPRESETGGPGKATLRRLLREGDPAAIGGAEEEASLRRIAARLEGVPIRRRPSFPLLPLAAAAALAAALLVVPRGAERAQAPGAAPTSARPVGVAAEAAPRQLQFETPGGTRLIWVLDPEFTLTPRP